MSQSFKEGNEGTIPHVYVFAVCIIEMGENEKRSFKMPPQQKLVWEVLFM